MKFIKEETRELTLDGVDMRFTQDDAWVARFYARNDEMYYCTLDSTAQDLDEQVSALKAGDIIRVKGKEGYRKYVDMNRREIKWSVFHVHEWEKIGHAD